MVLSLWNVNSKDKSLLAERNFDRLVLFFQLQIRNRLAVDTYTMIPLNTQREIEGERNGAKDREREREIGWHCTAGIFFYLTSQLIQMMIERAHAKRCFDTISSSRRLFCLFNDGINWSDNSVSNSIQLA